MHVSIADPPTAARPLSVRAFTAADIAEVGRLHAKVFPESPGESFRTPAAAAHYLPDVLLHGPRKADEFPSLVCLQDGVIIGFMGVVPLRLVYNGATCWACVSTQFVVDPDRRGLAGLLLMRQFLSGAQDLSFSDEYAALGIKIWERSGGALLSFASLRFSRPLRPAAFALSVLGARPGLAPLAQAARPLAWLVDAIAARLPRSPFGPSADSSTSEVLHVETMRALLPTRLAERPLRPDYEDEAALRWRLARADGYARRGPLRRALVRSAAGEALGWYIAYFPRGKVGEVLQVVASESTIAAVLNRLFADAARDGVIGLSGRLDPKLVQAYSDAHCIFSRRGPLMLAHARDPALMELLHRGEVFLSRLDGEWPARFE
jgi:hypothetical protein